MSKKRIETVTTDLREATFNSKVEALEPRVLLSGDLQVSTQQAPISAAGLLRLVAPSVVGAGDVALSGALEVSLVDNFRPTAGQVFNALNWNSSTGSFSSFKGLYTGQGIWLKPKVVANGLQLVATELPGLSELQADASEKAKNALDQVMTWMASPQKTGSLSLNAALDLKGLKLSGEWEMTVSRMAGDVPELSLTLNDGDLKLSLNGRNSPELKISNRYKEMLQQYSVKGKKDASQKEAILFVKQKIDSAKWFIDALVQRNQTLMVCMEAIIDHQKTFFLSGDESKLKPMILKDIADRVGMDISTISRMANSKYIQTPFGTYLLKYFFSEGLSTDDGEEASSREIKQILKDAIDQEQKSKPLPDEKLMALLNEKGYNIARRTVAKYREQLGIPVARLRKEI